MSRRVDIDAQARAEEGAAAALERWQLDRLHDPGADDELRRSWGIPAVTATRLVAAARRKRLA